MIVGHVGADLNWDYHVILRDLLTYGKEVTSRGLRHRELLGYRYVLEDVDRNVVWSETRKLNHAFRWVEPLWILLGESRFERLTTYNRRLAEFSDDGCSLSGAYGPRLVPQLPYIIDQLRQPGSRQAVATIWTPSPSSSKDIPCTISHQYLLRDDRLHLVVSMRSWDAWLGLPYDVFSFTTIQKVLACCLGVQPGSYVHVAGSLHLYETDLERASRYVPEPSHESESTFRWPGTPCEWTTCAEMLVEVGRLERQLAIGTVNRLPHELSAWQPAFDRFATKLTRRTNAS